MSLQTVQQQHIWEGVAVQHLSLLQLFQRGQYGQEPVPSGEVRGQAGALQALQQAADIW